MMTQSGGMKSVNHNVNVTFIESHASHSQSTNLSVHGTLHTVNKSYFTHSSPEHHLSATNSREVQRSLQRAHNTRILAMYFREPGGIYYFYHFIIPTTCEELLTSTLVYAKLIFFPLLNERVLTDGKWLFSRLNLHPLELNCSFRDGRKPHRATMTFQLLLVS